MIDLLNKLRVFQLHEATSDNVKVGEYIAVFNNLEDISSLYIIRSIINPDSMKLQHVYQAGVYCADENIPYIGYINHYFIVDRDSLHLYFDKFKVPTPKNL